MSSNIRVQRICQYCNTEFTARTTVTKYCSDKCSKRAYKERKKLIKVDRSNKETHNIKYKNLEEVKQKEYLTVKDAASLIGCSCKTIYRLINKGDLIAFNISERMTRIRKIDIDKLLTRPVPDKAEAATEFRWALEDCYSIGEIQTICGVSEKGLNDIIKRNAIPKKKSGRHTYVPKESIEPILNKKE
jgi:excisionase family DNA binding protein